TSFNCNAEPIVDSPDDAIACYLTTGLDVTVVGDFLLRRKAAKPSDALFGRLVPNLPASRKLVKRRRQVSNGRTTEQIHAIQCTRGPLFAPPETLLSERLHRLLQIVDGSLTLDAVRQRAGMA